jgi:hypothetical protein
MRVSGANPEHGPVLNLPWFSELQWPIGLPSNGLTRLGTLLPGAPRLLEDATIATLSDLRNDFEGSLDILSKWGSI